jgi:hypothetical protein
MSTRSNSISTKRQTKRPTRIRYGDLLLCLRNEGYEVSLEPRKIYVTIRDSDAAAEGQVRVIDESGDDYLFPASLFVPIQLPAALRRALLAAA